MIRPVLGLAACLIAVALTGCGHPSSAPHVDVAQAQAEAAKAPKDAPHASFCATWSKLDASAGADTDNATAFADFQDQLRSLERLGTPPGIPAEARHGFEVSVGAVLGGTWSEVSTGVKIDGISTADRKAAVAFTTWAAKACPAPK